MTANSIYEDIALRTGGNIYVGVVGPVRTGKSTFIKRFMETMVIPEIEDVYMRERAKDELPQSGSGKTIMTAEPKFVPEDAVSISLGGETKCSVRLIDCVGYMVPGAAGRMEGDKERMVSTPWFDHEITLSEAAETGTSKVIGEHSTIGLVITTDGSICDIPREDYVQAEERVITELQAIGKPFVVLVNSAQPRSETAQSIRSELAERFGVDALCVNCQELTEGGVKEILSSVLYAFPIRELRIQLPTWVDALSVEHPLRSSMLRAIASAADGMTRLRDVSSILSELNSSGENCRAYAGPALPGKGCASLCMELPQTLYYQTISEQSGFSIRSDGDLMALLTEMKGIRQEYDRVHQALVDVQETGYGVVLPGFEELTLEEPEIVRHGGRYSVRLRASAPSIHMIRANIETEVSPALGGEKASEEVINFLLQDFEGDVSRIWESNIFGKSLYDIAGEGVTAKIKRMPEASREKLQSAIERIVNEGSNGLICIIL